MDRSTAAVVLRGIQAVGAFVAGLALTLGMNAYSRLYRAAAGGGSVDPTFLAAQPESLVPHVAVLFAGLIAIELAQRRLERLRPNNSSKPTPLRGAA